MWAKGASFCKGWSGSVMPDPARDRCTNAWETILLFSKSARYCWDWFAARESAEWSRWGAQVSDKTVGKAGLAKDRSLAEIKASLDTGSRNWRNVWVIPLKGTNESHYAAFPQELPTKCIIAGTMPYVCSECGSPFQRMVEREDKRPWQERRKEGRKWVENEDHGRNDFGGSFEGKANNFTGWKSTCEHLCRLPAQSVVLDPFAGTGTTGRAARFLHLQMSIIKDEEMCPRDYILIDIGENYCKIINDKEEKPMHTSSGHTKKKPSKLTPFF